MKKKILQTTIGILILLFGLCSCNQKKARLEMIQEKTNRYLAEFQKELLGTLQTSIQKSGTSGAIEVCKDASPKMEENFSKLDKAKFRRVSLKNRNPDHFPNDWEKKAIENWEKQISEKQTVNIFLEETDTEVRFLKPIFIINETCLKCHGDKEIDSQTKEKIAKLYPLDKATGYKMGDLRGAFSVIWKK
ncbi:MAG: DUF3365 domain-containing protein [Leptospiraceae bacterium]|nr:DUF3365 domain-containing protein [Leptospiraceae bacterium]MCK6381224.1 DUF3365 domain-containing protein [Leptospiraceae bacterium]NUM40747.1 DUF3365 domain-containing protein [Leptospiraceae bacterium]